MSIDKKSVLLHAENQKKVLKLTFKHILRCFPLLLFVFYYTSISTFAHTHYADGQMIVHSHPFSPKAEHQHSANTFQLIQQISHFSSIEFFFGLLLLFFAVNFIFLAFRKVQNPDLLKYGYSLFCRPPPTLC